MKNASPFYVFSIIRIDMVHTQWNPESGVAVFRGLIVLVEVIFNRSSVQTSKKMMGNQLSNQFSKKSVCQ